MATGVQYALTDRLTLRGGYLFNTNPIPAPVTLFNVQAPAISQHTLSMGASYAVTENVTLSFAWMHAFDNSIEGPILQIPGSSVRANHQVDSIIAGVNITFGGRRKVAVPESIPGPQVVDEPPPYEPALPLADPGATMDSVQAPEPAAGPAPPLPGP